MQVRGLLVAIVLLAALGGLVWWSEKAERAKEGKPSPDASPKIVEIPEDQIQQVAINRRNGEQTVVRKSDRGAWEITAPKVVAADQESVKSMISTLSSLSSDRLVEEKTDDLAQFGLVEPTIEVTITKTDGKTVTLQLGDETPTGSGAFVKREDDPRVFTIASYNRSSLDKKASDLRDRRLLRFDSEKLSRVELTAKGQTMEFGKNARNEWTILKPRPLRADNFQTEELVRRLRDTRMDVSVSDEDVRKAAAAFASGTLVAVARVTDASGTQQMDVRRDKEKNYYARSTAVEGVYKITSDIGQGLDKGLDDFRNKKLFDFGFNDPTKIEIRQGEKVYAFEKSGEEWMSAGKRMDSTGVNNVVDKLRDLAATNFPETAGGAPHLELSVTWQEGKTTEKVFVTRQGNRYHARRDNEPAVYELDAKAVEEIQSAAADVKEHQREKKESDTKK